MATACTGDSAVLLMYDVRSKSRRKSGSQAAGLEIVPEIIRLLIS